MCKIATWNNRGAPSALFSKLTPLSSFLTPPFRNDGVVPDVQVQIEVKGKGDNQQQARCKRKISERNKTRNLLSVSAD